MKRITITLPEELASLVAHEAEIRGTSVSEVVRASLRTAMIRDGKRALPFAAICDDPSLVQGAAIDSALDAQWADDLDRGGR
ncbi:MAG TPA: CopG family transcriptional regulator [Thermoanaerobaculia bacterium]|nr:CopG family transcriptional regulator [Thermoanaerobaculia bacterium]